MGLGPGPSLVVDDAVAQQDLTDQPYGLRDFRILDPSGYYLRITDRRPGIL